MKNKGDYSPNQIKFAKALNLERSNLNEAFRLYREIDSEGMDPVNHLSKKIQDDQRDNIIYARWRIGNGYDYGLVGKIDYTEAARWYLKAMEFGNTDLGTTFPGIRLDARVMPMQRLFAFYYYGIGVQKDKSQAIDWVLKVEKYFKQDSLYPLMLTFMINQNVLPDTFEEYNNIDEKTTYEKGMAALSKGQKERGVKLILACAFLGNNEFSVHAQAKAGLLLLRGEGIQKNKELALKLLYNIPNNNIDTGDSESNYKLGMMFRTGEYVNKNDVLSNSLLHKAADAGSSNAKKVLYADEQASKREQAKKEKDAENSLKLWGALLAAEAHAKASRSPKEKCNDRCKEEASHCEAKNRGNDFLVGTSGTFSTRGYGLAINSDCSSQLSSCLNHCK